MTDFVSVLASEWLCLSVCQWLTLSQCFPVTDVVSVLASDWRCLRVCRTCRCYPRRQISANSQFSSRCAVRSETPIMHTTPSLRSFPNVAFETVPMFVWLTMALSRPVKEDRLALPLSTPLSYIAHCCWFKGTSSQYVTPRWRDQEEVHIAKSEVKSDWQFMV